MDICVIAIYFLLLFWSSSIFGGTVGSFSGFPKGDDAQVHSGFILFFSKNWAHSRWFPYWYGGFPISLSYHPLANYVWASFVLLTGSSIEFTLFFFSALSYIVTAIVLYLIVYKITENHNSALITPILTIASGGFISILATGGAYTRVFATMLWILSFYFLINYIKTGGSKKFFLGTVISLASAVTSNVLIGIFTGLTLFVTLLLCIEGWKRKLFHIFKIFLPAATLSAFFYMPFFFYYLKMFVSFGLSGGHYSTPMPLLYLGASSFLPLLYLLISTFLVKFLKIEFDGFTSNVLKTLKVLILFLFLYGLLDWPQNVRFFATYDITYFLPIYLSIYSGILFGGIFDKIRFMKPNAAHQLQPISYFISIKQKGRKILPVIALLGVVILPFFYFPLLMSYVTDSGASSLNNPAYAAEQLLKIDPEETNFRFSTDWIHVIRWFNYHYSNVSQTGGVNAMAIPYPNWCSWYDRAVFTSEDNWQETNFLLDWYAVKYLLIGEIVSYGGGGMFTRYGLIDKFLSKPEYYENASKINVPPGPWAGQIYQFNYRYAKPILSATNATTLLITDEPQFYDNLFRSLAYANFNESCIIPIRGLRYIDEYSLEQLKKFDAVSILLNGNYYLNLNKTWELLSQYVRDGGSLFLEGDSSGLSLIPTPSPISAAYRANLQGTVWNFSIATHAITNLTNFELFSTPGSVAYSAPEDIRPGAQVILWNNNDALVVIGQYGKGRVVWNGLNLSQRVSNNKNLVEAFFLSQMLKWVSKKSEEELRFEINQVKQTKLTFKRPNPERVEIYVKYISKGILFKESYFDIWHAYLIGDDGLIENLDIQRAGPDFMYVNLPNNAVYPIKVVFEYRITVIEWFSNIASISTLVILIVYGLGLPIDKPVVYALKKLRKSVKVRRGG